MKTFADESTYQFPVTVRHQGTLIVLALYDGEDEKEKGSIYYRVLALDPSQASDEEGWTPRKKIEFPDQIRPAGMSLVTVGQADLDQAPKGPKRPAQTTRHPFQALSDGRHIYIFRQSPENTLYVDRFVFDATQNEFKRTWEARFQRSRKRDVPAGRKDTLGPRDMEKEPFVEPTLELHNVQDLVDGRFCVLTVPTSKPGESRWQIFAYNAKTGMMDSYSILRSADGLFDPRDLIERSLKLEDASGTPYAINSGPAAVLYMRQEEVTDDYGRKQRLKRETRVMLATATQNQASATSRPIAVIDFGVAQDGTLADIDGDTATLRVLEVKTDADGTPMPSSMPIISPDLHGVNGPTVIGSFLSFAHSDHTPCLLDSADGLVHLYFRFAIPEHEETGAFYVVHFETLTSRATHTLPLTVATLDSSSESGKDQPATLRFTARLSGARMNDYEIEIKAGQDSDTCQVRLQKGTVSETWTDVPRRLPAFMAVLNGQAAIDKQEAGVLAGERVWYDYQGKVKRSGLPSSEEPLYGSLLFGVSAQHLPADSRTLMVPVTGKGAKPDEKGQDCRWIPEPPNYALQLNGLGDQVQIKKSQALDTPGDVTVEGWVKFDSKWDEAGNYQGPIEYLFSHQWPDPPGQREDAQSIEFGVERDNRGAIATIYAARQMPGKSPNIIKAPTKKPDETTEVIATKWAHLAATYQASNALHLDGDGYVDCGNDLSLNMGTAITIEAWVTREREGVEGVVASKWSDDAQAGWMLGINSDGTPVFRTGKEDDPLVGTTRLEAGQAHHLAAVFSAESRMEDVLVFGPPAAVEIPYSDRLDFDQDDDFTVELWVKPTGKPENGKGGPEKEGVIIEKMPVGGSWEHPFPYSIRYTAEKKVKVRRTGMTDETGNAIVSQATLEFGVFNHLALVKEGTELRLYIDGKLDPSTPVEDSTTGTTSNREKTMLGWHRVDNTDSVQRMYFHGEMNEIRIWRTARSQEEILENLLERNMGQHEDLVGYWPVGGADGKTKTVADVSGNDNDGTLNLAKVEERDRGVYAQTLYVDGERVGQQTLPKEAMLEQTRQPLTIGRGAVGYASFQGTIDEVRLWKTGRAAGQIDYYRENPIKILTAKGLVSYWPCDETPGARSVEDAKSENHGRIIHPDRRKMPDMLVPSDRNARWTIYVNGHPIPEEEYEAVDESTIRQAKAGSIASIGLNLAGSIDEVRVWNTVKTGEQIADSMYRRLGDSEDELLGYWRFDASGAAVIRDQTGNGADAVLSGVAHEWPEGAPVSNEGPEVNNSYGVPKTEQMYYVPKPQPGEMYIEGTPAVAEYGDMQWDSDGNLLGVMKRCYAFAEKPARFMRMVTGFAVGNLDLQFIGQVQTAPTLIGYIEGAPPVPSENLTLNPGDMHAYAGASSIELTEAHETIQIYSTSRDRGVDALTDVKQGSRAAQTVGLSVGAFVTVSANLSDFYKNQGLHYSIETSNGLLDDATLTAATARTMTKALKLGGSWERPRDYDRSNRPRFLDPRLGQRYIPDNVGYALVKSGTADLFGLRLRQTGSLVAYHIQPNPDIPEDWNIIMFPLNPGYVKNGTLDGMVGLAADPDYPNAISGERGSYFKPLEAYALKDRIEREDKRLAGYYERFDGDRSLAPTSEGGKTDLLHLIGLIGEVGNSELDMASELETALGPGWKSGQTKRGLVNTYVWTARGGFYAEEEQFSHTQQESLGSFASSGGLAGEYLDYEWTVSGIGGFGERDALAGIHLNVTKIKSQEDRSAFGMQVHVDGEASIDEWNEAEGRYVPIPGKVASYRFMTFYLAPDLNSFDAFFHKVVDPAWLERQGKYQGTFDPDAQALKQAENRANEVWRVLHRVTYVSRVPEQFGSPPAEVIAPAVREPDNIAANWDLVQEVGWLATRLAAQDTENKSKLMILGEAIDRFLEKGQGLGRLLPWWETATNDDKKQEIRKDLLTYLKDWFEIYPWPKDTRVDWHMEVEHRPGAKIIVGSLPEAGIELTVTDPWGNATTTVSGSKPKYGAGGFEVLAGEVTTYTLAFRGETFDVPTHDGATIVTFTRAAIPPSQPG